VPFIPFVDCALSGMSLAMVGLVLMPLLRTFVTLTALTIATVAWTLSSSSTARLLQFSDLSYVGAFRLPAEGAGGDTFETGGMPIAYSPANNSLFVGSRRGNIAEVTIPTPVKGTAVLQLPFAKYLQAFADPTENNLTQIADSGVSISGLLVSESRLYGTGYIYYDAMHVQTLSHYSRSLKLSEPSFKGMYAVGEKGKAGFVSGYLATVPPEWQAPLGGSAITGQCCIPIVSRTSFGPAAFAWNPARLGTISPLPAIPLQYYTGDHQTLGTWDRSSSIYGETTQIGGLAIIAGTRTALFFGRNGTGRNCYGDGTSTISLAGTRAADGAIYCYDPTSNYKGPHAYPYRYQVWAYDLNDWAAVKAGRKQPWEVVPYGVWPLSLPTPTPDGVIGGVGYDAARQLVYLSQMYADLDRYASRPVIHVFDVH
jgi:hypothetical protein